MATFHEDLRKILNYVNVIALVAIGAYFWTDYNEERPAPPKPLSVSYLKAPITPTGAPQLIMGSVVGISDGDTVTVRDETNTEHKIRLEGIDAPESDQAYGPESQEALASQVLDKHVLVKWTGKDGYGRILGHIYIGSDWVNKQMVQRGWAWHYKGYSNDAVLAQAEVNARKAKVGLWTDPAAPWDYQKGVLLDEPSDPNSKFEIFDRLIVPPKSWRDHQPGPRILPFIEKTPETKESTVYTT